MRSLIKAYGARCYYVLIAATVFAAPRHDPVFEAKYFFWISWIPACRRFIELSQFPVKTFWFQVSALVLSPLVTAQILAAYDKARIESLDDKMIVNVLIGTFLLLVAMAVLGCQDGYTGQGLAGAPIAGLSGSVFFLALVGPLFAYFPLWMANGFVLATYVAAVRMIKK